MVGRRSVSRYVGIGAVIAATLAGCTSSPPVAPGSPNARVTFVFLGSTTRRTDLTPAQESCARFVGPTHVHASWRNFQAVNMTAVGSDRWEVLLEDVPAGIRLSIMVADQNACIEDPEGWVTRNVQANSVPLNQVVNVNNGRGLGFTVAADGRVTP
jgi:hypothetical protein